MAISVNGAARPSAAIPTSPMRGTTCPACLMMAAGLSLSVHTSYGQDANERDMIGGEQVFSLDDVTVSEEFATAETGGSSLWTDALANLRFNVDLVSRLGLSKERGKPGMFNTLGVDVHTVLGDAQGDWATLLAQVHVARRDNAAPLPHHAEDDDDWELEFHEVHLTMTRWGRGRSNIRIGRQTVPYGLEQTAETHLTLYQTISHENLGLKRDWGIGVLGSLPKMEYAVAVTQASGHEYWNVGKNFALAGRLGTPSDRNLAVGASAFYGQVRTEHGIHRWRDGLGSPSRVDRVLRRSPDKGRGEDNLLRSLRVGVDFTYLWEAWTFKAELSAGRDYDQDVVNGLAEIAWASADESVYAYLQGINLAHETAAGWDEDVLVRIGGACNLNAHVQVSAQYEQDISVFGSRSRDAVFQFQWRVRF